MAKYNEERLGKVQLGAQDVSDVGALPAPIRAYNLHRLEDQLSSLAKPCIRILPVRTDDDAVPIGASKFGGHPDVPQGFEWPHWGRRTH